MVLRKKEVLTAEVEVAITLQEVSVPLAGLSQGSQVDGGAQQSMKAARRLLNHREMGLDFQS